MSTVSCILILATILSSQIYVITSDSLKETDLNSNTLSPFAKYFLETARDVNIYPTLFNISFVKSTFKENIYNEMVYLAVDMGLFVVGDLPKKVADASVKAIKHLTPLKYLKVISNSFERILKAKNALSQCTYKVILQFNGIALRNAANSLKINNAEDALHALIVGASAFYKSFGATSEDAKLILMTLADEFNSVS